MEEEVNNRCTFRTSHNCLWNNQKCHGHCLATPNPYKSSKSTGNTNLYRRAPPICNAVSCWLLSLEEREPPQYTSNLYCSTPPICTAMRLPFVPAMLLRKYQWLGVPESSRNFDGSAFNQHVATLTITISRSMLMLLPKALNFGSPRLCFVPGGGEGLIATMSSEYL